MQSKTSTTSWLDTLLHDPIFRQHVVHHRVLPRRPPRTAPFPADLHPSLVEALQHRGVSALYTHQAAAVEAALQGQHVLLVTPTASGKTLAYNVPVLQTLLQDPNARALYIYPTKALAQDQCMAFQQLADALPMACRVAVYDGDTPAAARREIRASAHVVMTNPDMLHTGILPHHTKWLSFWTNLRYIVLDEVHHYRGVFGSHLANLLRRSRRIAEFYGCRPQFLCGSATIANPREFVERLIDAPVHLVDENGAPAGERHFFFIDPPVVDRDLNLRRSALLEGRRVAGAFISRGAQTIIFTRARLSTEVLLTYLRKDAPALGITPKAIRGYRGGYLARERREIERGLREGRVRAVVSTNALELGIDIGALQACVIVGYPGTIASTWQQAGRVGRRGTPSAVALVASAAPLDQFLVHHPEWFFESSPEHARINPDNLSILIDHLRCAAFELPFRPGEAFGSLPAEAVHVLLDFLVEEGALHKAADTYYWSAPAYPSEQVSLRTITPHRILIVEQPGGTPIGEVDRFAVHQMCFPGAIYLHEGRQYRITALDWEEGRADAVAVEVAYYTRPLTKTSVTPQNVLTQVGAHAVGEVEVVRRTTGYKQIRFFTHEVLGQHTLTLPESRLHTAAYWVSLPETCTPPRRDYGPNWETQRRKARERDGFRCQVCGISERELGRELDVHHKRPFREFGYDPTDPARANRYLEANALENLISLCPACHRRVEPPYLSEIALGLQGIAHALEHVAPLFLMCDPADIGVTSDMDNAFTRRPTIFVYEYAEGGIGFAEQLFALRARIWETVGMLIQECPCERGCPSCVGPQIETEPQHDAKQVALKVWTLLQSDEPKE
nr:DEAD/DEAH box helicase [Ardenticatena sp.]